MLTVDATRADVRIRCSEIWGGTGSVDLDMATGPVTASLYSRASDGGRGGDIYYFSVCEGETIARVALADVLGHGDAVSRMSQRIYHALAASMNHLDGSEILAELNRVAHERGRKAITTAVVLSFDVDQSSFYLSYAGHPPILIRRDNGTLWRPLRPKPQPEPVNLPLGAFPDTAYRQEQRRLASGDRLFLYTDGLTDAASPDGRSFGVDGLRDVLEQAGGESLFHLKHSVLAAVRSHTGGSLGDDDLSFVAVEVHGEAAGQS